MPATSTYLLDYAKIEWQGNSPYSPAHGDIYWSAGNPALEKQFVFPDQHDLPNRNAEQFCIVETGFGFGNTFLLTAEQWRKQRNAGILTYIGVENSPVKPDDLARHYQVVNMPGSDWLLNNYPLPFRGRSLLWQADNVRLMLIFDDAISALSELSADVDAWFLDGFSPASNTDLWNQQLYGRMYSLSKPGATISSYTAAGHVRRGLEHAGFSSRKIPGFNHKAEMLMAEKPGKWLASQPAKRKVIVLGAGMAGQYCVEALQRRSIEALLISDPGSRPASQIPQLAVCPTLGVHNEPQYQFSIAANAYMQQHNQYFHPMSMKWQSSDAKQQARMQRIARQFPDSYLQELSGGALRYGCAGWATCPDMATNQHLSASVQNIAFSDGEWHIYDQQGLLIASAAQVIVAMAMASVNFTGIDLQPVRGQALTLKLAHPDIALINQQMLLGDVSLIPNQSAGTNYFSLGSTFQRQDSDLMPRDLDNKQLIDKLNKVFPDVTAEIVSDYVGIRATSRDRLPQIGPVPDWHIQDSQGAKTSWQASSGYQQGLYVSSGFGAHGATHARLCSEHIANLITGEALALSRPQQKILAPERFCLRDEKA